MLTIYSFYIYYMFTIFSQYIGDIFTMYSLYINDMFTIYRLYIHYIFTICSTYIRHTFSVCSLYIHYIYILHVHYIFPIYLMYVCNKFTLYSLYVHYIFTMYSMYIDQLCCDNINDWLIEPFLMSSQRSNKLIRSMMGNVPRTRINNLYVANYTLVFDLRKLLIKSRNQNIFPVFKMNPIRCQILFPMIYSLLVQKLQVGEAPQATSAFYSVKLCRIFLIWQNIVFICKLHFSHFIKYSFSSFTKYSFTHSVKLVLPVSQNAVYLL